MNLKNNLHLLLAFIVMFWGCNSSIEECNKLELGIIKSITDNDKNIKIKDFTLFEWEELYVICGPRSENEIDLIAGIEYNKVLQDDSNLYLFLLNKKIVHEEISSCNKISFNRIYGRNGWVYFSNESYFEISIRNSMNPVLYEVTGGNINK